MYARALLRYLTVCLCRLPALRAGESDQILVHVDDQQLQLLSRRDGRSTQKFNVLGGSKRQTKVVRYLCTYIFIMPRP